MHGAEDLSCRRIIKILNGEMRVNDIEGIIGESYIADVHAECTDLRNSFLERPDAFFGKIHGSHNKTLFEKEVGIASIAAAKIKQLCTFAVWHTFHEFLYKRIHLPFRFIVPLEHRGKYTAPFLLP